MNQQLQAIVEKLTEDSKIEINSKKKEALRMKKEPFKTMVEPTSDQTRDALRGWNQPAGGYILMEKREIQITGEGEARWGTGLYTMNVAQKPDQVQWKVEYYTGPYKQFKLLHYGNFPSHDSKSPDQRRLARIHSGPNGENPWDELAKYLDTKMNISLRQTAEVKALTGQIEEKDRELLSMQARIADYERQIKERGNAKDTRISGSQGAQIPTGEKGNRE